MIASVLITNYNNSKFIDDCIISLKNQTYSKIEILFHDDGSSDNSLEVIKKYSDIIIIENKIKTKYGSLNQLNAFKKMYELSSGEILFFLDSDDYFHKTKIYNIIKEFENSEKSQIIFDYPQILENGKNYFEKKKKKIFKSYWSYIHPTSCISIRKDTAEELFKYINVQDYFDTWMDFRTNIYSKYLNKSIKILDEHLTVYRKSSTNVSSNFKKFSKNWWKRRKEAHDYLFFFLKKNGIKTNNNLDKIITNLVCKFF